VRNFQQLRIETEWNWKVITSNGSRPTLSPKHDSEAVIAALQDGVGVHQVVGKRADSCGTRITRLNQHAAVLSASVFEQFKHSTAQRRPALVVEATAIAI
jgi:hypothetical protein